MILALTNKEMKVAHEYIILNFSKLQFLLHSEISNLESFSDFFFFEYLSKVQEGDSQLSEITFSKDYSKKSSSIKRLESVVENSNLDLVNSLYKNSFLIIENVRLRFLEKRMKQDFKGHLQLTIFFFNPEGRFEFLLIHFMKMNKMIKNQEEREQTRNFINFYRIKMITFGRLINTTIIMVKNIEGLNKVWGISLKSVHLNRVHSIRRMIQEQRIHWESLLE
jgi:hypothetical protein